ncbi:MAG TPA: HAMP domain-containing histidine kinase, partial [Rhodospirillales bacterium]|nr:HAMP domain-containing histidine kinase [Rhodospirillales bacterium]
MNGADGSSLRPPWGRGLSSRILALSVAFLLLGEILIYLPSIARFRLTYLEERLARAYIATLPLDPAGTVPVAMEIEDAILSHVGLLQIRIRRPDGELVLGQPAPVARTFDLAEANWVSLIYDSLEALAARGTRLIRVRAPATTEVGAEVEIVLPEAAMWMEMVDYSQRILLLSLTLAIILASLLFWSLRRMIVRPLCEVTEHLARFSVAPEDATHDLTPSGRRDELGIVERQVARMQCELRRAFLQKTRLAALGAAVARINHDLKNILASAMLISDRLEHSGDPRVQQPASRLLLTLERAARLCTTTLDFARSAPEAPRLRRFPLRELVEEVVASARDDIRVETEVPPDLTVSADRDQLYRVLLNLLRNAEQVLGEDGKVRIAATREDGAVVLTVEDNGPGVPEKVRERLFQPFAAGNAGGGTGLGLAICKEILRAHGGDIALARSDSRGTRFRLWLPDGQRH